MALYATDLQPHTRVVPPAEVVERLGDKLPWHRPECSEVPHEKPPGVGHNSARRLDDLTVFEQFEAIVDCQGYSAEQKCILVKIRCRVNSKTMGGAIDSNEGLMRAASLKDPRALRAELRDLQGKARELPEGRDAKGRPITDPIDESRATIVIEERRGKASVIGFTPDRLHAIVAAYLQHKEEKRGPGRPWPDKPPASDAPPLSDKSPASRTGGLSGKPPAPDTGGPDKPPASHAVNPLRQTHPDPFLSKKEEERGADAPAPEEASATKKPPKKSSKPKVSEEEIEAAVDAYNEAAELHDFTICRTITGERKHKLAKRLPEIGGVDGLRRALSAIPRNDFLMGRVPPKPGQEPFRLDIEKLLSTGSGMGDVLAKLIDSASDSSTRQPAAHTNRNARGEVVF